MTRLKQWWDEMSQASELLWRAQRPWEQEGPLRWCRRIGGRWELHGSTIRTDDHQRAG